MIKSDIYLAYVGSIVPDEKTYHNAAFSRAGNMCQLALLDGLMKTDLCPTEVLSVRPAASFPRSSKILYLKSYATLANGIRVNFIPFINITPIKQLTFGIASLLSQLKWAWRMRKHTNKIIYTYNISVPPGVFTLLGAWFTGSKCVAMIYDIFVPGETIPATLLNRFDYWLHKKVMPLFDGLIVITDSIAKDFAPEVPFLVVEGGIKAHLLEQFAAIESATCRNKELFTIVIAGSLDEANGIYEIIEAFALLHGEHLRLEIAGGGVLESLVREAASSDTRITFHGLLSFEEVLKLYAKADVLVNMRLTKRLNTKYFFPSKIMEYLTTGVPVISTCPGNMADEYGQYAYLLHDETSQELAGMIQKLADMHIEERLERSRSARSFMVAHKTWDYQALKIADFIHKLFLNEQKGL